MDRKRTKDFYKILQVDPAADPEVIAAAYKRLSLKYHPDTNPSPQATERMQEINEAYQVLKDPARRAYYDRGWEPSTYGARGATSGQQPDASQREPRPPAPSTRRDLQISTAFTIVYILVVFTLFRLVRPVHPLVYVGVIVLAGVIAYSISARLEEYFRRKK